MTTGCAEFRKWIPMSLAGDLTGDEQESLDLHLTSCPSCRLEHKRYSETLRMLMQAEDEPVPRHFFVYPKERILNPWQLFRQMMPRWQVLTAGFAGVLLMLALVSAASLQVKAEQGAWIVSFGGNHGSGYDVNQGGIPDITALKTEILKAAEAQNREAMREWVQSLQVDLSYMRADLTRQQQAYLDVALSNLESQFNERIILASDSVRDGAERSMLQIYQTVSMQHQDDVEDLNARLDDVILTGDTRARQTDAILETLLQIANMSFRQPGDQK